MKPIPRLSASDVPFQPVADARSAAPDCLAFARFRGDNIGHVVTFFVIAVAAAEAAVGLALVLGLFRHTKSVDLDAMRAMRN